MCLVFNCAWVTTVTVASQRSDLKWKKCKLQGSKRIFKTYQFHFYLHQQRMIHHSDNQIIVTCETCFSQSGKRDLSQVNFTRFEF